MNSPWLIEINARVRPQPGQSIPNTRRLVHVSGKGELNPGKKTAFSPSVRIRIDINKIIAAIIKNRKCIRISLRTNAGRTGGRLGVSTTGGSLTGTGSTETVLTRDLLKQRPTKNDFVRGVIFPIVRNRVGRIANLDPFD